MVFINTYGIALLVSDAVFLSCFYCCTWTIGITKDKPCTFKI